MKKFKYIILAAIALVFVGVSCSDGEEIVKKLDVDVNQLNMANIAQTKAIVVNVDKGEKIVAQWDGGDWANVEVTATGVNLILKSNNSPEDRNGAVLIRLESKMRSHVVKVTQYGNNPALSVLPEEVSFDFMGGESQIEVTSSYIWEVKSDVEWLSVKEYPQSNTVVLTVQKNKTKVARSTIVLVKSGRTTKEVLVKQDQGMYFILPYLEYENYSTGQYSVFEENRHSVKAPGPMMLYLTHSAIFDKIVYYDNDYNKAAELMLSRAYGFNYFETDEFKNEIIGSGFEFIASVAGDTFYWLDRPGTGNNHSMLQISATFPTLMTYYMDPDKPTIEADAETYTEYPYPPQELMWNATMNDVKNWEVANGGTVKLEDVEAISFSVTESEIFHERVYGFSKAEDGGKLYSTIHILHNVDKVFTRALFGYKINAKFEVILGAEGFKFMKLAPNTDPIYYNEAKNFYVIFSPLIDKTTEIMYTGAYYYETHPHPDPAGTKSHLYQPEYKTIIQDYVRAGDDRKEMLKKVRENTIKALASEGLTL